MVISVLWERLIPWASVVPRSWVCCFLFLFLCFNWFYLVVSSSATLIKISHCRIHYSSSSRLPRDSLLRETISTLLFEGSTPPLPGKTNRLTLLTVSKDLVNLYIQRFSVYQTKSLQLYVPIRSFPMKHSWVSFYAKITKVLY